MKYLYIYSLCHIVFFIREGVYLVDISHTHTYIYLENNIIDYANQHKGYLWYFTILYTHPQGQVYYSKTVKGYRMIQSNSAVYLYPVLVFLT